MVRRDGQHYCPGVARFRYGMAQAMNEHEKDVLIYFSAWFFLGITVVFGIAVFSGQSETNLQRKCKNFGVVELNGEPFKCDPMQVRGTK